MSKGITHYSVLGVEIDATTEEITKGCITELSRLKKIFSKREISETYFTSKVVEIIESHDTLTDEYTKFAYDAIIENPELSSEQAFIKKARQTAIGNLKIPLDWNPKPETDCYIEMISNIINNLNDTNLMNLMSRFFQDDYNCYFTPAKLATILNHIIRIKDNQINAQKVWEIGVKVISAGIDNTVCESIFQVLSILPSFHNEEVEQSILPSFPVEEVEQWIKEVLSDSSVDKEEDINNYLKELIMYYNLNVILPPLPEKPIKKNTFLNRLRNINKPKSQK